MIKSDKLVDQINKEINSIMEVQERLGSETETYKRNTEAVKDYVNMLNALDEASRKDRELDLKVLEEKRHSLELEMKRAEIKAASDSKLRSDIFDLVKCGAGFVMMKDLMDGMFNFEKEGVFTSKIGTPLIGTAVRLFTNVFSKK